MTYRPYTTLGRDWGGESRGLRVSGRVLLVDIPNNHKG